MPQNVRHLSGSFLAFGNSGFPRKEHANEIKLRKLENKH